MLNDEFIHPDQVMYLIHPCNFSLSHMVRVKLAWGSSSHFVVRPATWCTFTRYSLLYINGFVILCLLCKVLITILPTILILLPLVWIIILWILQAGHTVTGVEGVPFVVEQFFRFGCTRIFYTESVLHFAIFQGKQMGLWKDKSPRDQGVED